MSTRALIAALLDSYPQLAPPQELEPITAGLINTTYGWGAGHVVQRLNPIFAAEVNLDIAALVGPLRAGGVPAPEILHATTGKPWTTVSGLGEHDGVWRVLSRLPGRTIHRIERPEQASAAARMLARFHGALMDSEHTFAFARLGVHDTPKHMQTLVEALAIHTDHRLFSAVAPVAEEVLERWAAWGAMPALPRRVGHGDPKVSNFLFANGQDEVVGVIDLDTMGWTTIDAELGDALRSWCNTQDESGAEPTVDQVIWEVAVTAYGEEAAAWITPAELDAIPAGVERICLELTSRFAADALNERYFGWDPAVASSQGEHNLIRARNQLGLARHVKALRAGTNVR